MASTSNQVNSIKNENEYIKNLKNESTLKLDFGPLLSKQYSKFVLDKSKFKLELEKLKNAKNVISIVISNLPAGPRVEWKNNNTSLKYSLLSKLVESVKDLPKLRTLFIDIRFCADDYICVKRKKFKNYFQIYVADDLKSMKYLHEIKITFNQTDYIYNINDPFAKLAKITELHFKNESDDLQKQFKADDKWFDDPFLCQRLLKHSLIKEYKKYFSYSAGSPSWEWTLQYLKQAVKAKSLAFKAATTLIDQKRGTNLGEALVCDLINNVSLSKCSEIIEFLCHHNHSTIDRERMNSFVWKKNKTSLLNYAIKNDFAVVTSKFSANQFMSNKHSDLPIIDLPSIIKTPLECLLDVHLFAHENTWIKAAHKTIEFKTESGFINYLFGSIHEFIKILDNKDSNPREISDLYREKLLSLSHKISHAVLVTKRCKHLGATNSYTLAKGKEQALLTNAKHAIKTLQKLVQAEKINETKTTIISTNKDTIFTNSNKTSSSSTITTISYCND